MSFWGFLEEKIMEVMFQIFFLAFVAFLLIFHGVDRRFVAAAVLVFLSMQGLFQWCLYRKKRKLSKHITDLADSLAETYYIADVLPKPKEFQNQAYYYALKKACKSMNDEISKITEEKQAYQEYVESFAHEIKIPIGALSLTFDNTKNYTLKKETDKIFRLVEQMLYYARSENTEKDYFIKPVQLDNVIHNVILKFRHALMEGKVIINIQDTENLVYTDEKWLTFVLSQIVQNSIKYFDKQEKQLNIYSQDYGTNVQLSIEDNGCGIKASDLSRVFEKGFTGSNRNKANATGMGLYLAKKLCDRLGLKLDIMSREQEYTRIIITFPKGTVHHFSK
ncbi:MAG: sensor histidine kinase [Blautia sp.]